MLRLRLAFPRLLKHPPKKMSGKGVLLTVVMETLGGALAIWYYWTQEGANAPAAIFCGALMGLTILGQWYFHQLDKYPGSYFRIIFDLTYVPAMLAFLFIFFILGSITGNSLILITSTMVSITLFTLAIVIWQRRKGIKFEGHYLKRARVVLDWTEVLYWTIIAVVLFLLADRYREEALLSKNWETAIKIFTLPFMIQTRVIKAYAGARLQKLSE